MLHYFVDLHCFFSLTFGYHKIMCEKCHSVFVVATFFLYYNNQPARITNNFKQFSSCSFELNSFAIEIITILGFNSLKNISEQKKC